MKIGRSHILSCNGGDRATGYTMNSKILLLSDGIFCSWLDSFRLNQWALVDRGGLRTITTGSIGEPGVDNHCGATLVRSDGEIHALIGGHHGPLSHHVLDSDSWRWDHVGKAGASATYPCAVCDSSGTIHCFYRCSSDDRWFLNYVRYKDGVWTDPVNLVIAAKQGYVYWTNGATVGPDDTVHLVFGNAKPQKDGGIRYGVSHICTRDGGDYWWSSDGGEVLTMSIDASRLAFLDDVSDDRSYQTAEEIEALSEPGPVNYNYYQMNLSNPVADKQGNLHAILHNNRSGTASLCSWTEGVWRDRPLNPSLREGERIHPQSTLGISEHGDLTAALMVESTDCCEWGPNGTYLIAAKVSDTKHEFDMLCEPRDDVAQWLPAFAHSTPTEVDLLLYTKGRNAGGFGDNANELLTDVILAELI